jgi:phosphate transport system protein
MNEHTSKRFEDELGELKEKVLEMGALVEKAIHRSMSSLVEFDPKRARKVIARDKDINQLEVDIDAMTNHLLALRQPAAGDLRFIIATIKIVTDLERSGDMAEGIAERTIQSEDHPMTHVDSMETMADMVVDQTRDALNAFAAGDVELALKVIAKDKKVNKMHRSIQREYITYMLEDPREITNGLASASVTKNLERMGDHAVNIAEMVIYMIEGYDVRHVAPKAAASMVHGEEIND